MFRAELEERVPRANSGMLKEQLSDWCRPEGDPEWFQMAIELSSERQKQRAQTDSIKLIIDSLGGSTHR